MSDKDSLRGSIRYHLKKTVEDILQEEKISAYELSRKTNSNETLWKNFLDGRTKLPDSEAIVSLAEYRNASLDVVVGKDEIIGKDKNKETQIPASLAKLSPEDLQSIMLVGEKTAEFTHKSPPKSNEPKKSFSEQEQARRSNKATGRSR
ncbi:MAG: hypothetical protein RCO49_04945 [Rickettsia endosymbiont of Argas persicus]